MSTLDTSLSPPTTEDISKAAYQLWENEGRPEGRDQEFWYLAETALTTVKPEPKARKTARPRRKKAA